MTLRQGPRKTNASLTDSCVVGKDRKFRSRCEKLELDACRIAAKNELCGAAAKSTVRDSDSRNHAKSNGYRAGGSGSRSLRNSTFFCASVDGGAGFAITSLGMMETRGMIGDKKIGRSGVRRTELSPSESDVQGGSDAMAFQSTRRRVLVLVPALFSAMLSVSIAAEKETPGSDSSESDFRTLVLKQFDKNHNGRLDPSEKTAATRALAAKSSNPKLQALRAQGSRNSTITATASSTDKRSRRPWRRSTPNRTTLRRHLGRPKARAVPPPRPVRAEAAGGRQIPRNSRLRPGRMPSRDG